MNEEKYRFIAENFFGYFDPNHPDQKYNPKDGEAQEYYDAMTSMYGKQVTSCGLEITVQDIEDYLNEIRALT